VIIAIRTFALMDKNIKMQTKEGRKLKERPQAKPKVISRGIRNKLPLGKELEKVMSNIKDMKIQRLAEGTEEEGSQPSLHGSFLGTFGHNPSGSAKELVTQYVDFFDYVYDDSGTGQHIRQYKFNPNFNNLFPPASLQPSANVSRVERVKLWALPNFQIDTADSSCIVDFGVPVHSVSDVKYVPGATPTVEVDAFRGTAAQKSTLLTPTSVSDWVKVGEWHAKSLFDDSNFSPAYDSLGNQALFTAVVVYPDNGAAYARNVQFMVEIEVAQTLAPLSQIEMTLIQTTRSEAWYDALPQGTGFTPAFVQMKTLRNAI